MKVPSFLISGFFLINLSFAQDIKSSDLLNGIIEKNDQVLKMIDSSTKRESCSLLGVVDAYGDLLKDEIMGMSFDKKRNGKKLLKKIRHYQKNSNYSWHLCNNYFSAMDFFFGVGRGDTKKRLKRGQRRMKRLNAFVQRKDISLERPLQKNNIKSIIGKINDIVGALPMLHSCDERGNNCASLGWQKPICFEIGKIVGLRDVLMKFEGSQSLPAIWQFNYTLDNELELEICRNGRFASKYRREVQNLKNSLNQMLTAPL